MRNTIQKLTSAAYGLSLLAAAALGAGGCVDQARVNHADDFDPDIQARQTSRLLDAQADAGARSDATMYPMHFDGTALNSLGTGKLDRMLADDRRATPVVVYMDMPEDAAAADRRLSVGNYLMDRGGLKVEQIQFQHGPNPGMNVPAASGLKNLPKTDSTSGGDAADPAAVPGGKS